LIKNPADAVVQVFHPKDGLKPMGLYGAAITQTELLRKMGLAVPQDPDSFGVYFRLLYQLSVPDQCGIQKARSRLQFREVDELFEFIEDKTFSVLILYELIDGKIKCTEAKMIYEKACSRFHPQREKRGYLTRDEWRKIQPYILNLSKNSSTDQREAIRWKIRPAFDKEDDLFVWEGVYRGGLAGIGIDFDGPIPAERMIL